MSSPVGYRYLCSSMDQNPSSMQTEQQPSYEYQPVASSDEVQVKERRGQCVVNFWKSHCSKAAFDRNVQSLRWKSTCETYQKFIDNKHWKITAFFATIAIAAFRLLSLLILRPIGSFFIGIAALVVLFAWARQDCFDNMKKGTAEQRAEAIAQRKLEKKQKKQQEKLKVEEAADKEIIRVCQLSKDSDTRFSQDVRAAVRQKAERIVADAKYESDFFGIVTKRLAELKEEFFKEVDSQVAGETGISAKFAFIEGCMDAINAVRMTTPELAAKCTQCNIWLNNFNDHILPIKNIRELAQKPKCDIPFKDILKKFQDTDKLYAAVYETSKNRATLLIESAKNSGDFYKNIAPMFGALQKEFYAFIDKHVGSDKAQKAKAAYTDAFLDLIFEEYLKDEKRPTITEFLRGWGPSTRKAFLQRMLDEKDELSIQFAILQEQTDVISLELLSQLRLNEQNILDFDSLPSESRVSSLPGFGELEKNKQKYDVFKEIGTVKADSSQTAADFFALLGG